MNWPKFADKPFKMVKVPDDLYSDIKQFYNECNFSDTETDVYYDKDYGEYIAGGSIAFKPLPTQQHNFDRIKNPYTHISYVPSEKLYEWAVRLQPILEEWSNQKLEPTAAFGIRSYQQDSILCLHRDNIETHVISCIIFLEESPEGMNWPLDFWDHDGVRHKVVFEKGDMLLYESLCVHARYNPFQGDYYRNMYFHWKPVGWDHTPYKENKVKYICTMEVDDEYR